MAAAEAKVTMIGATGSGKTTYLHGMYSVMSAGFKGYSLITTDLDDDLDMSDAWTDLCDDGTVPEPGGTDRRLYSFIFRQRGETLLTFDWEDYRGGAMSDRNKNASATDVGPLQQRMLTSDSIYLVLNGSHLTGATPLDGGGSIRDRTFSGRMNGLLNHTLHKRTELGTAPPSIVVMVTKADLIRRANPGASAAELMEAICFSAEALLPACFEAGLDILVCPVQIGDFGEDNADRTKKVDPLKVDPRNLPYPLVHTFLNFLDARTRGLRGDAAELQQAIDRSAAELEAFSKSWRVLLQPGRAGTVLATIKRQEENLAGLRAALQKTDSQVARLAADLEQAMIENLVAVYEDGDRLG